MDTNHEIARDFNEKGILTPSANTDPSVEYRSLSDYGDSVGAVYIELKGDRYTLLKSALGSDKDRIFLDSRDIEKLEDFFSPA